MDGSAGGVDTPRRPTWLRTGYYWTGVRVGGEKRTVQADRRVWLRNESAFEPLPFATSSPSPRVSERPFESLTRCNQIIVTSLWQGTLSRASAFEPLISVRIVVLLPHCHVGPWTRGRLCRPSRCSRSFTSCSRPTEAAFTRAGHRSGETKNYLRSNLLQLLPRKSA